MLTIRHEQMHILEKHSISAKMLQHARKVAPEVCAKTSPKHLDAIVAYCLQRCQHYGLSRDYDILRYLNLMLVFGVAFDREQAWAAAPLAFPNPAGRMELLMDHALGQLPAAAGPEDGDEPSF